MKNIKKLLEIVRKSSKRYGFLSGLQLFHIASLGFLYRSRCTMRYLGFRINTPNPRLLLALINEIFVKEEYFLAASQVGKGNPLIIDAGSNIGVSLLYWKYYFADPRIVAFEPAPSLVELCRNNVENNQINALVEEVALGESEGVVNFFKDDNHLTTGSTDKSRGGGDFYEVKQRRLSDYIREYNDIDLVKIDIEGGESSVLKDLIQENLLYKPYSYIIEYHLRINDLESQKNLATIIKHFSDIGFVFSLKSLEFTTGGFQDILLYFKKDDLR